MLYRVIISSLGKDGANPKPIYEQVVDNLDVKLVIHAVNAAASPKPTATASPAPAGVRRKRVRNRRPSVVPPPAPEEPAAA